MRAALVLPLLLLLAACGDAEVSCGAPGDASGSWTYTGTQSSPSAALSGTVTLERTGTCTVQGSGSLTVDQGSGTPPTYPATIGGVFIDDNTLSLTITANGVRLHTGDIVADTLQGNWYADDMSGATGTFRMVRTP